MAHPAAGDHHRVRQRRTGQAARLWWPLMFPWRPGRRWQVCACALALATGWGLAGAQQVPEVGFVSVGRGAPLADDVNRLEPVGATLQRDGKFIGSAPAGQTPRGITPLARDLFTTTDFYADLALWSDPRYFRCNSPIAIENLWAGAAG